MKIIASFASVWDAIADMPEQAANLGARAELMQKIAALLQEQGWTQRWSNASPVGQPFATQECQESRPDGPRYLFAPVTADLLSVTRQDRSRPSNIAPTRPAIE